MAAGCSSVTAGSRQSRCYNLGRVRNYVLLNISADDTHGESCACLAQLGCCPRLHLPAAASQTQDRRGARHADAGSTDALSWLQCDASPPASAVPVDLRCQGPGSGALQCLGAYLCEGAEPGKRAGPSLPISLRKSLGHPSEIWQSRKRAAVSGKADEIRGGRGSFAGAIATWRLLHRSGRAEGRRRVPGTLLPDPAARGEARTPAKVRQRLCPCSGAVRLERLPSPGVAFSPMRAALLRGTNSLPLPRMFYAVGTHGHFELSRLPRGLKPRSPREQM
ncbi:hypothetical protein NDU88_007073 [Pleurodeles waltl]|uniref:Uncharacterized protein n=1 Tax=Pleurodeles waltl TaxID=8319 RepID=A0AAV7PSG6_PLEWA|nr:hypothetical protein NDU88_007073 [Pleurodeles waltl]